MSVPEKTSASKRSKLSRKEKRRADSSANSMSMVRWFRQRKSYKRPRIWKDNEMDSQVEKDHLEEGELEEVESGGDAKPPYKPEFQYSREELMKYMEHPLSRKKPIITDPNIDSLLCWIKSGPWNNYKRSDTPTDRGDDSYKRRSNDPRERVRKEQDGIVLSPQRRSFNSGCFVTVAPNTVSRPSEPVKDGPVRRIGSGRIINRDWDFREKENTDDGYSYRPSVGPSPRERDERYDMRRNYSGLSMDRELIRDVSRESLSRDKEMRTDARGRDRDRMQRYSNDRNRRYEAEEPEWFSGGPTSQHDTIELRGFEDRDDSGPRNKSKPMNKNITKPNSRDSRSNTESRKSSSEEISVQRGMSKEAEPEPPAANSSPKAEPRESPKAETDLAPAEDANRTENHDFNFNLEDFLQLDNLPLLTNGGGGEGNQSSSRFSQWFRRDSPPDANDTRRSSIQDEIIKNIINDINEPSINIPNMKESDAYFAPISPAGTTSGNSLLEMLQGSHQQNEHRGKPPSIKDLEASGKVTSVEELEARMRQGAGQSPVTQNSQNQQKKGVSSNKKEEELIAFKKLLKQVLEGDVTTASVPSEQAIRSHTLSQMLNKPPEPSDMMGQAHQPNTAASMHVPQDLVYKLLHVQEQQRQVQQQQEFNKLLFSSGRLAPPPVHGALSPIPPEIQVLVANSQPSAELLNRPEAQAILQGLRQGELTPQHLITQLQNQGMQPRHRDMIASILKLHAGSPRPTSPLMVPPDPALIQQLMLQQQLRIPSPLPPMHNGLPHRVPSPRELMLHTQTIMQSALIKKKLEEQRENYRKRQEMQRATSPNVAAGAKSPNLTTATSNANNNNPTNTSSTNNNINNNNNNNNSTTTAATTTAATSNSNSNTTATKSPTPLAFTPTSVLRKMTAEQQPQPKDGDGNKNKYNELIKLQRQNELLKIQAAQVAQSSRFLPNNQLLGLRSPQQQWSMPKQPMQQPMQQGRAIVKGSGSYAPAPPPGTGLVDLPYGNNARPVYPQRSKLTIPTTPLVQPNLYNSFPSSANRGPPNRGYAPQMGPLAQPNVNMNPALQQLLMSQNMTSAQQRNMYKPDIRNSFHQFLPGNGGDGDLSTSPTTSNQLAHWFTPELLAQAQAQTRSGKADSTLNMVSVEELERLQQNSAPVLN